MTLAAPKLPLVLPPAETRAGDIVIADIGIPAEVLEAVDGPRVDLLTRGVDARADRAADGRQPQGRLRPRARRRRLARQDRRGASRRRSARCGRAPGWSPSPRRPSCQPIVAAMAPEYMTEALAETDDGLDPDGVDRVLDMARDVIAHRPGLGQARGTREFIRRLVDRAAMPLVIDADGLNAFVDDPDRLAGREGRDVIITPHPGEMARLVGMSTDEVQASRLEIARNFAGGAPRVRRAEGAPHADRDAGREGVHQPDRQSRAWRPAAPATCSPA